MNLSFAEAQRVLDLYRHDPRDVDLVAWIREQAGAITVRAMNGAPGPFMVVLPPGLRPAPQVSLFDGPAPLPGDGAMWALKLEADLQALLPIARGEIFALRQHLERLITAEVTAMLGAHREGG